MPSFPIPLTLPNYVTTPILPLLRNETQKPKPISSFPYQQPRHHKPFSMIRIHFQTLQVHETVKQTHHKARMSVQEISNKIESILH